jgi:TPR repeat protein
MGKEAFMQTHPRKIIENQLPLPELLSRAEQGDADCQYWAGIRYFQGEGLPEDEGKAVDLCALAAAQGHSRAFAFLAYCSSKGVVLPKNQRNAARWYRFAAKDDYAPAQHSLALHYLEGSGVKKNARLAVKWLEKAAAQDMAESLCVLGSLYEAGEDVVQDEERACRYFRRAAGLGYAKGQYRLSGMLMSGRGTQPDALQAIELIEEACAQGFEPAFRIRAHLDEFLCFDPKEAGFDDFPVKHPFPVRRRTAVSMEALGRPCLQAIASDIFDYLRENPKNEEAGLKDIAALLATAAEAGASPLTFFV